MVIKGDRAPGGISAPCNSPPGGIRAPRTAEPDELLAMLGQPEGRGFELVVANWDCPEALHTEELAAHLRELKRGRRLCEERQSRHWCRSCATIA